MTAEIDAAQAKLSETQSRLAVKTTELEESKQATHQANAKIAELEQRATEAEADQAKMQLSLDQANAEIERLNNELRQRQGISPQGTPGTELSRSPTAGQ